MADVGEIREVGVGVLGYAFMGKAHSNAYRQLGYLDWPPPALPRLVGIAGRSKESVEEAARRYGYERASTDWRSLVEDPAVELFDNCGPNDQHAEPSIAAARAGKHVVCEKPLGRDAAESHAIWKAVEATGVTHMCAFNYRFVPAVRLARELIEAGELGELHHVRVRYLQDWGAAADADAWRFRREEAGSGALGDIAAHGIDLVRYLAGEIAAVAGTLRTFVPDRTVDDAVSAVIELEGGALGTVEATRLATGRRNALQWELNGSRGSLAFDLERLNELELFREDGDRARGFRRIVVSEGHHPFWERWWPPGHLLGWGDTFVHELGHLLESLGGSVAPHGATFEDGYRTAEVCDAIVRSSESGERQRVAYRS